MHGRRSNCGAKDRELYSIVTRILRNMYYLKSKCQSIGTQHDYII